MIKIILLILSFIISLIALILSLISYSRSKEYFIDDNNILVLTENGKKKLPKSSFNKKNNLSIHLITLTDKNYFDLVKQLINSFIEHNPQNIHKVTIYDVGMTENQIKELNNFEIKKITRSDNIYRDKVKIVKDAYDNCNKDILLFSDAACKFLAPSYRLTNFIKDNKFFAGTTQTPVLTWIKSNPYFYEYYKKNSIIDYTKDKQYDLNSKEGLTGVETGFLGFLMKNKFTKDIIQELTNLEQNEGQLFPVFPFDQIVVAYVLHQLLFSGKYPELKLHDHPNIRYDWIQDKNKIAEKGTLSYDPEKDPIPFFGYCYHNRSSHPLTPDKRKK